MLQGGKKGGGKKKKEQLLWRFDEKEEKGNRTRKS